MVGRSDGTACPRLPRRGGGAWSEQGRFREQPHQLLVDPLAWVRKVVNVVKPV